MQHRGATSPELHPDPYHTACNLRACDPAVVCPNLLARAQALPMIVKRAHQGAHPLLNPQPLPPHGDDVAHPLLNPQPLPPRDDDGFQPA